MTFFTFPVVGPIVKANSIELENEFNLSLTATEDVKLLENPPRPKQSIPKESKEKTSSTGSKRVRFEGDTPDGYGTKKSKSP